LVEPVGDRLVGEDLDFNGGRKRGGTALRRRELRELLGKFALGKRQIGLGQGLAVDGGDHRRRINGGSGRSRSRGGRFLRLYGRQGKHGEPEDESKAGQR